MSRETQITPNLPWAKSVLRTQPTSSVIKEHLKYDDPCEGKGQEE